MLLSLLLSLASASAEEVAAILAVDGDVQVVTARGPVEGVPRLPLDRADKVVTGEEGAAILLLSNNRLVRVDEDLSLAVADLVLLGAPKTTVPVKEQLADLLYPGERDTMRGLEDAERIAGWQARLSAATAVPAQRELARSAAKSVAPDAFAEAAEEGASSEDAGYTRVESPAPAPAAAPPPPSPDLPVFAAADVEAMAAGELADCMKAWRKESGFKKGAPVTFHVRVEGGRIARLVGDGGVTPPRCLRDEIVGGGASGDFDVTLTLP